MSALPPAKRHRPNPATPLNRPFKSPLKTANATTPPPPPPSPQTNPTTTPTHSTISPPTTILPTSDQPSNLPITAQPPLPPTSTPPHNLPTLQKSHLRLTTHLTVLQRELDLTTQALALEANPQRDTELRALIAKWRTASQKAAEEVYAGVRDRVNKMGGVKGLKDMEREGRERRREWEREEMGGGEGGQRGEEDGEREEGEGEDGDGEGEEEEEEEEEEGYTMDMMLRSLNVELGVIGFDKEGQRWVD